jgi:HK97 family phage portal protein
VGVIARALSGPQNTEITTSAELDQILRRGNQVWAGMHVTPENAVEVAAVMASVRVIAEDVGKLPRIIYRRVPPAPGSTVERRQRASDTDEWRLIHDSPNNWQSSQAFCETLTAWALLRGNGYALKVRSGNRVSALLPLPSYRVKVEQLPDMELIYRVRFNNDTERILTRRDVFHVAGLSLDGIQGTGIVGLARQTIGIAFAAQRHAGRFYANGLQTSGVLKHPKVLKPEAYERLKASITEAFSADNVYSPMILEESMDWAQTGLSNRDSQFLESRKFEVTEIARWFRLSPHKIADLDRATHSNIEQQSVEHVTDTLMPWTGRWDHAFSNQVLPKDMYCEHLFDAVLRGTTLDRYRAHQIAAGGNAPWISRNEIRVRENLDPIAGLDEVLVPMNMGGENDELPESGGDG